MNWIEPRYFSLVLLWLPLMGVVFASTWWHRRRVRAAFEGELADRVLPRGTRFRRTLRDVGFALALLAFITALAEPAFDKQIVQSEVEGVDLIVAMDLSRSMDAQDIDPSRLERARREVRDLIQLVTGDRVALIFFAGDAYVRMPLTADRKAVDWVLDEASTERFASQGSQVGRAIDVALALVERDSGEAGKAMLIVSDGETHEPEDALRAARDAAAVSLPIYVIGVGERASTIPDGRGGVVLHDNQQVMTAPDFGTLKEIANITGGAIVKSTPSNQDVADLYGAIRTSVDSARRSSQQTETWRTAFQYPLGLGLGVWWLGAWLGDGRRSFGAAAALLLVAMTVPSVGHASVTDADQHYRNGDFARAERVLEELVVQQPGNADLFERLGAARYRMEDFAGSAAAYERAAALGGDASSDLYNAGNARYRAGQLEAAMERYDQALAAGGHARAQANRDAVAGELEARRAQKPPPPPSEEPQAGDDEQEGDGGSGDPSEDPAAGDSGGEQPEGDEGEGEEPQDSPEKDGSDDPGENKGESEGDKSGDSEGQSDGGEDADGEPSDPNENPNGVDPDELDQKEEEGQGSAGGDPSDQQGEGSGTISAAQASRLLDAVEEGKLNTLHSGRRGAKPW